MVYNVSMKPSFLTSTLSIAFLLCVLSVIVMAFINVTPDEKVLAIISGVVFAYLSSRSPVGSTEVKKEEPREEITIRE